MKHDINGPNEPIDVNLNVNVKVDIPMEKATVLVDLVFYSALSVIAASTVSHIVKSFFPRG